MNGPAVRVRDLRVVRGGREVLHGVTCAVARGTVTGLLGPSGSGKSTLLRALVGVQAQVRGQVEVLGLPAGSPELHRRVGWGMQDPAVYDDLTVAEDLRFFAAALGVGRDGVDRVLAEVDLADQADALVGELSGGQRSRVGLAAALLGEPELLVLDEPTVGLDPVLRRDLWALFRRLAAAGTTLLVSSHVMDEAARCDRLLLLRRGRLVADDTADGLLAATGAPDLDSAFLRLAERDAQVPA